MINNGKIDHTIDQKSNEGWIENMDWKMKFIQQNVKKRVV
jgi:hypothetical protein